MTDHDAPGIGRAWGWVAHLRDGGTTPWAQWSDSGQTGGPYLPGAQQLELLRRLNASGTVPTALATRVLEASAPGRGRPDLELVGAVPQRAFGPAPVDPAELPTEELLRVAAGLLAEDVFAAGVPDPPQAGLVRPWRRRYRLAGDPMLAGPVRAQLIARGRPPGGRGSTVLVLGTDLGQMLVDAWTARSLAQGAPTWPQWLARAARADNPPARTDLLRTAQRWSEQVGVARVQVVLDLTELPRLLRVRGPLDPGPAIPADAVDLARRVGDVLGLLAVPAHREALLHRTLLPRLADAPGEPLVLPQRRTQWARAHARRMRDGLLEGGYAVHGHPDGLLPVDRPGVAEPAEAGVLTLALRLLLEKK